MVKVKVKIAKRILMAVCVAVVASFAVAGNAFAATVHGADCYGTGSALESGEIDVLDVDGVAGETVFLTVKYNDNAIAKNLPYTIGEGEDAGSDAEYAGVATLDISSLDLGALDGSYTIEAYSDRAGKDRLYAGSIYGVYADLPDGTQKLIGTRTVNATELSRVFSPAETLYVGGKNYRLAGGASGARALSFPYEAYNEATTIDGVIKYVDATGATIASTKIPGLEYGESRIVEIPTAIKADDGALYRPVFFQKSVTAANPGSASFSIYCVKMSEASQALAGHYVATINMVDEAGNLIASDSVNVTGDYLYTAPSTIYKTETINGQSTVVTYEIEDSPTIAMSAANDGVLNHTRTITVKYKASTAGEKEVKVTYNLLDGSKRIDEEGRVLGTQEITATKEAPAKPESQLEFGGVTYYLAGSPDDYIYEVGSGKAPVVDVYYTPEGYEPPGAYTVKVNYVNFLTNAVIESHEYSSDPNENARLTISTPATFSADGIDYIRLDGQEDDIAHSYYSGIAEYTVYYRDKNDTLTSGTVITRIRVVYVDGGSTTIPADGATGTTGATGTGAAADGTEEMRLNSERTYNVMDGADGNGTLTNESGVDSNTERIEDSETPLASGFEKTSSSAASSLSGMMQLLIPVGIAVLVAIVAIGALVVMRRRRNDEEYEL